jgi:hypothetical protein
MEEETDEATAERVVTGSPQRKSGFKKRPMSPMRSSQYVLFLLPHFPCSTSFYLLLLLSRVTRRSPLVWLDLRRSPKGCRLLQVRLDLPGYPLLPFFQFPRLLR